MSGGRLLLYRAGPAARALIRRHGLSPSMIRAFAGPASGPKWLVLSGIDRAIMASGLLDNGPPSGDCDRPLLVGASAGGWRALTMACPDRAAAYRELEDGYVRQVFGRGVTPAEISAAYHSMLGRLMTPERTAHVLGCSTVDVALHVARARGPAGSSRRRVQAAVMVVAAGLNSVSARTMRLFFRRVLLHTRPERWCVDFDGYVVPLTVDNLLPAALATGTIPLYMHAVRGLPGASGDRFIDGGLTDYHLNQRYTNDTEGIVLFPHFQERIVPNWFDRYLPRRSPSRGVVDHVLQVYPSPEFVAGLPEGRIPNRDDFIRLIDDPRLRILRWREAAAASDRLGEQLLDDLERGRLPDLVREM
jgi:hypothetical protein